MAQKPAYKRISEIEEHVRVHDGNLNTADAAVLQVLATLAVAQAIIEVGNVQGAIEEVAGQMRYLR